MKSFAAAVLFAVVVAVGASTVLNSSFQTPSYLAFATEGARVDDPGTNLVTY